MANTKTTAGGSTAMLTYSEVSEATGASTATIGRLVRSGQLGSVRLGPRSVRVPAAELEQFLSRGGIRNWGDDA